MNFKYKIKALKITRVFSKKLLAGFLGLLLGLTAFMLIVQYAFFENSYDDFHENSSRICRVIQKNYTEGNYLNTEALCGRLVGETLKQDYVEIENFTRVHKAYGNPRVTYENMMFYEDDNCFYVEPSFFDIFSFPLLKGNAQDLEKPDVVFITEKIAKKYFGDEDPIGKQLEFGDIFGSKTYFVEGIVKDIPNNSHIHFDFLFSNSEVLKNRWYNDRNWAWTWNNYFTYILLDSQNDFSNLQKKVSEFAENHVNESISNENKSVEYILQPLLEIHLNADIADDMPGCKDKRKIEFLILISLMVFILSLSNFINLYSLSILDRAKEFGVKYVVGAPLKDHFKNFLKEAFVFIIILIMGVLLLVTVTNSKFNEIVGLSFENPFWEIPVFWYIIVAVFILGILIFGSYPLLLISKFNVTTVLKGKGADLKSTTIKRKVMVILQFSVFLVLIISSLSINRQIEFMENQDLGFDVNNKIVAKMPSAQEYGTGIWRIMYSMINVLETEQIIDNATCSACLPGSQYQNKGFIRRINDEEVNNKMANYIWVDNGYTDVFNIKLLAGSNFPKLPIGGSQRALVNRSAAKLLGFQNLEDIINTKITWLAGTAEVFGVIDDYHHLSLKEKKVPIVLFEFNPSGKAYMCIGIKNENFKEAIEVFEKKYKEFLPDIPFDYSFLKDTYNKQYEAEKRFGKMTQLYTIIILVLSVLSLFGLISYLMYIKTKEIAIRKIHGTPALNLYFISIKSILYSLLISVLIAVPFSYFWLNNWLNNFAYRMEISFWSFLLPIIGILIIALITTLSTVLKVIFTNPIKVLKEE